MSDDADRVQTREGRHQLAVLYLDTDEEMLAQLSEAVETAESVELTATSDPDEAYGVIHQRELDCIVVESDFPTIEWEWLDTTVDVPVVVYTETPLTAVGEPKVEAADTFVQKRGGSEDHRFLLEKIRGTVESRNGNRTRPLQEGTAKLSADLAAGQAVFLVDEDDDVQWSNRPFDDVFPVEEVDGTVPDTANLDRRLAAVLDNDPELTRAVLTNAPEETVIGVPVDDPEVFVQFDQFAAGDDVPGDRFYTFQPVTPAIERYDDADLFARLVENVRDGLYVLDADARLVYCNESYAEMFGYDREEMLGEHTAKWMAPGELQKGQRAVETLLETDTGSHVVDVEFRTRGGDRITRSVHFTLRERDGGYGGLLGVVRRPSPVDDETAERYRPLLTGVDVPKLLVDDECTVRVCNAPAADVFGRPVEDIEDRRLHTAVADVPGGQDLRTRVRQALDSPSDAVRSWVGEVGLSGDRRQITVERLTSEEFTGAVLTLRPAEA